MKEEPFEPEDLEESGYIVSVMKRKRKNDESEKNEKGDKRVHRSLKDNPRPIITPALRKRKEKEVQESEQPPPYKTQISPAIANQPDIRKEKKIEKEIRDQERLQATASENIEMPSDEPEIIDIQVDDIDAPSSSSKPNKVINVEEDEDIDMPSSSSKPSDPLVKLINDKVNKNKPPAKPPPKTPRKITMQSGEEVYDVIKDLNNTKCNITFGQLMDVSPKLRSQVSHGLKLEKNKDKITGVVDNVVATTIMVNNLNHSYVSKSKEVNEDDIAMIDISVEGVKGKALIDSCSNLSIITKQFLDKLPSKYSPVGISRGRIRLATMNEEYSESYVVEVPIQINKLKIVVPCRIVDTEEPFYDIILNLKTQMDHKMFIHPLLYSLCQFSPTGSINVIAPINNQYEDEPKLMCVVKAISTKKSDLKKLEGLPPMEYINSKEFLKTIDPKYRKTIRRLLKDNIMIVATSSEELTPSKLAPHKIRLKANARPIKQKYYRLTKLKSDILKEEIAKLIKKKLIEPSYSEWSSPIVLIPKPNGKWRLCIDYRKVNDVTEKDSYSLPNIDEIFDSLDGARFFSTLDLYSGYHQILMDPESVEITTFTTKFGNYQFKVMPFGLTGAPATFQREMNKILFPFIGKFVYNFIDDVLIYSKTKEEHIEHLRQVLNVFKENELKINIEKCTFMKEEVEVLGHKVSSKGLSPLDSKVEAIKNWKAPENVHELRSFLGAIGYYRDFIEHFAQITAPLCKLLKKNAKFVWTSEQESSFNQLKEKLINAPILKFPCFEKEFIIRTDASYDGIEGVLLQKDEKSGKEHPVHYISRSLNKHEKKYGITDLEGTALMYCLSKFKPYIMGNPIQTIVYTDHKPLLGLFKNKEPNNARQTRWCLTLSMLNVELRYEPGKRNVLADALSRLKPMDKTIVATKFDNKINEELLSKTIKEFMNEKITTINGIDYFIDGNNYRKLITDTNEKIKLILEAHYVGHEGYQKTYQRLKKHFYWNDMVNDIRRVISKCDKCQLNKSQPYPEPTEDIPTQVEAPFTHLGLDIVGPLKKTTNGNEYIIVIVDYFTKWVEAEPTQDITSHDVIKFLIKVFSRHGVPQTVTADNGVQFTSDMTKIFIDLYDVYIKFTSTYHPESNGLTENRNKEIGKLLRLLGSKYREWDEILPSALWALRTAKNSVTGHSSFELVYGREDQQPFDIAARPTKEVNKSTDEVLLEKFINHYLWTIEAADNIRNASKYWAMRREEKNSMNKGKYIKPGDLVLVRNFSRNKLEPYFVGPLKVIKKQFNTVTLADPNTGIQLNRNVHLKNIVKYNSAIE